MDSKRPPSADESDSVEPIEPGPWTEAVARELTSRLPQILAAALDKAGLTKRIEELAARLGPPTNGKPSQSATRAERSGSPSPPGDDSAARTCSEPDCDQPARARDLCSKHYQRLRYAEKRALEQGRPPPTSLAEARASQTRQPIRKTEKRGGGNCSQPGCDRPNYAKGMCGKHFMEWVRSQKNEAP